MCRKYIFCIYIVFISLSEGFWLPFVNLSEQLRDDLDIDSENETEAPESVLDNNETIIEESNSLLFSTIELTNITQPNETQDEVGSTEKASTSAFFEDTTELKENSTEADNTVEADEVEEMELSETKAPNLNQNFSEMNEKIVLQRSNCNLEMTVDEYYEMKILVKFEALKIPGTGKCSIALNGPESSFLGVLISNINLQNDNFKSEVLNVIVANSGTDFVLKQYTGVNDHLPLLLTETNKVYIVLNYNITLINSSESSYFNLEVFNYHNNNNKINTGNPINYQSYFSAYPMRNVENIYFTTEKPYNFGDIFYYENFN